jgi:cytochrome P450
VEEVAPLLRGIADELLDAVVGTGRLDLVLDYANPLPAIVTMHLIGLPLEGWERFASAMHAVLYTPPGPEHDRVVAAMQDLTATVVDEIRDRRRSPRDDLLSALAHAEVDGATLTNRQIVEIVNLIIAGGVDTTTAVTANTLLYLARHEDARRVLVERPEARRLACEEFLRYFSPVQALARTVAHDAVLGGQELHAGDRVLVCWAGANQDPSAFDRPDEVVLDRFPNRHAAFGLGLHRCLGSNVARAEMLAMLDAILDRVPDYTVDDLDALQRYPSIGTVNGWVSIPASFTPRDPLGVRVLDRLR